MRASRRSLPGPRHLLEAEFQDVDETGRARRARRLLQQRLALERIEIEVLAEEVDERDVVDVAIERRRRRRLPAEPFEVPVYERHDAVTRAGGDLVVAVFAPGHARL